MKKHKLRNFKTIVNELDPLGRDRKQAGYI